MTFKRRVAGERREAMTQMIFINLPVTNVARSTAFYEALGWAN